MAKEAMCCPKFDPSLWDGKEVSWKDRLFVKDSVSAIMHVPLNMGSVMTRMINKIDAAEARSDEFLILSLEESPWRSEQFMPVAKEVPGIENVKLSGTYLTKVFEGPYQQAKSWYIEMANYVKSKGKEVDKIYFYYTTCPKCAKKYGKNYVVLFARVK
jgi:hypothetical protein